MQPKFILLEDIPYPRGVSAVLPRFGFCYEFSPLDSGIAA
jgi:hypothetical protein